MAQWIQQAWLSTLTEGFSSFLIIIYWNKWCTDLRRKWHRTEKTEGNKNVFNRLHISHEWTSLQHFLVRLGLGKMFVCGVRKCWSLRSPQLKRWSGFYLHVTINHRKDHPQVETRGTGSCCFSINYISVSPHRTAPHHLYHLTASYVFIYILPVTNHISSLSSVPRGEISWQGKSQWGQMSGGLAEYKAPLWYWNSNILYSRYMRFLWSTEDIKRHILAYIFSKLLYNRKKNCK